MDIDLKLASRISVIEIILGGHTHDGMPLPHCRAKLGWVNCRHQCRIAWKISRGNDFEVKHGRLIDCRYNLLPVFSDLLPADEAMQATIDRVRARSPLDSKNT